MYARVKILIPLHQILLVTAQGLDKELNCVLNEVNAKHWTLCSAATGVQHFLYKYKGKQNKTPKQTPQLTDATHHELNV